MSTTDHALRYKISAAIAIAEENRYDSAAAQKSRRDNIGNSSLMAESLPCAIDISVAANFSPFESVALAANLGGDADTTAMISGAVSGAWSEADDLPIDLITRLEEVNSVSIVDLVDGMSAREH